MKCFYSFLWVSLLVIAVGCSSPQSQQSNVETPFINPPLKGVDIQYDDFTLLADKGDTIYYKSGSIIVFPPNAFVDGNGQLISGEVKISYREFADPIDFFIAGIPMTYELNGVQTIFESSGMCEVLANQKGNPLFVNPQNRPQINLRSFSNDTTHRIYYLDTQQRKWLEKGTSEIADFTYNPSNKESEESESLDFNAFEPVMPVKESAERPTFFITIEPGSVPELEAYNHLKFEVSPDDKNYDPTYGQILWDDVTIKRGRKKATYIVTFSKGDISVSILALPVVEEKYYNDAMQTYKIKKKEYDAMVEKQLKANQKQLIENQKTQTKYDALNILIQTRNERFSERKQVRLQEQLIAIQAKLKQQGITMQEVENFEKELRQKEEELLKAQKLKESIERYKEGGVSTFMEIYRTFQIDGFGVWNSDLPCMLANRGAIKIKAQFVDESNQKLRLNMVQVIYKSFNGINANHNFESDHIFPELDVIPNDENMIWSVLNNRLYYLNYEDFKQYQISTATQSTIFKMRVATDSIRTADDLRKVLKM